MSKKYEKKILIFLIVILSYMLCYCTYQLRNPMAPFKNIITKPKDIIIFKKEEKYQYNLENILNLYLKENDYGK